MAPKLRQLPGRRASRRAREHNETPNEKLTIRGRRIIAVAIQLLPLSSVIAARNTVGDALKVPFAAEHQDQPVEVLAVLQRTAIVHPAGAAVWDQRGMVRLTALLVDPERLEWVHQLTPAEFQRRRKAAFSIGQHKSRGEAGQR